MHNNKTGPCKQGCLGASFFLNYGLFARSSVEQVRQRITTAGLRPLHPDDVVQYGMWCDISGVPVIDVF